LPQIGHVEAPAELGCEPLREFFENCLAVRGALHAALILLDNLDPVFLAVEAPVAEPLELS
jgi:hypothetical protein